MYRYLGRYTQRVANSNALHVSIEDQDVDFRTRGQDTANLNPVEFIRRFSRPPFAQRLRQDPSRRSLLSPTNVNGRLASAKAALAGGDRRGAGVATVDTVGLVPKIADLPWADLLLALTGVDLKECPVCHAHAVVRVPLTTECRGPPATALPN